MTQIERNEALAVVGDHVRDLAKLLGVLDPDRITAVNVDRAGTTVVYADDAGTTRVIRSVTLEGRPRFRAPVPAEAPLLPDRVVRHESLTPTTIGVPVERANAARDLLADVLGVTPDDHISLRGINNAVHVLNEYGLLR